MRINEGSIKELRPPAKDNRVHWDDDLSGFGFRLTAAGAAAFVINYRFRGRQRRYTIGAAPPWTAKAARTRASELLRLIDQGIDPQAEREDDRNAPLMSDFFPRYLYEHAEKKKKTRSVAEDRKLIHGANDGDLAGPIGRFFGKMQIQAVTRADVIKFHAGLSTTPYHANRCLALLSKMFNLAEAWELRAQNTNPCKHIERYREAKRERYLNADELARLGSALEASDEAPAVIAAIRLLLFTGCRVSELIALRWLDVDMKLGRARLVDAKAGGRDVQLPAAALHILAGLPVNTETVLGIEYNHLDKAWRRIRKAAKLDGVRLHDLRHTTGTYAGASGHNAFIVRDLLGHKTLAMTGRYVEKYVDPLRAASEAVSAQIEAAMKGESAEIVRLVKP
jgi:integrase